MPRSTEPSSTLAKMSLARWNSTCAPGSAGIVARYWRGLVRLTFRPHERRNSRVESSIPLLGSAIRRLSGRGSIAIRPLPLAIPVSDRRALERRSHRLDQLRLPDRLLLARAHAPQHHLTPLPLALPNQDCQRHAD